MADNNGDSQMISSPSSSDLEGTHTPANQQPSSSVISPPDSQHRSTMPVSNSGAAIANANGKRPINTISNGTDDVGGIIAMQTGTSEATAAGKGVAKQDFPTKTHEESGYQWNRVEDEPGYAWTNKKATDEYHRAFDALVHKDSAVKGKYGDPFEAVDKEKATIKSLKEK